MSARGWGDFNNIVEYIPGGNDGKEYLTIKKKNGTTIMIPLDEIEEITPVQERIVEIHDTIEVEKIVEVEVPVEVEKIVEVHDTIYVYDDSRSAITLPTGDVITLTIHDGVINIEDAPLNSTIYVYSLSGELVEMRKVYEKDTVLRLPRNATYIIKTCDKTFKVKI